MSGSVKNTLAYNTEAGMSEIAIWEKMNWTEWDEDWY
jgi:hypothetical protein